MSRVPLSFGAARTLRTLREATLKAPGADFDCGRQSVRMDGVLVETVQLIHPGLPGGTLTVDEAHLAELCASGVVAPVFGRRLRPQAVRLAARVVGQTAAPVREDGRTVLRPIDLPARTTA